MPILYGSFQQDSSRLRTQWQYVRYFSWRNRPHVHAFIRMDCSLACLACRIYRFQSNYFLFEFWCALFFFSYIYNLCTIPFQFSTNCKIIVNTFILASTVFHGYCVKANWFGWKTWVKYNSCLFLFDFHKL